MIQRVYAKPELCTGCQICSVMCSINKFGEANPKLGAIQVFREPFQKHEWQTLCRHCETPPCIDACMTGSLQKDPESGIVFNDLDKCIGCFMCEMLCPFGAIHVDRKREAAIQCDLCREKETGPICVSVCPTGALKCAEVV